jgi:hypothetical protein
VHVEQHDIDPTALHDFQGFFAGFRFVKDEKRTVFEDFSEDRAKGRIIVRNQQLKLFFDQSNHDSSNLKLGVRLRDCILQLETNISTRARTIQRIATFFQSELLTDRLFS